MAYISRKTPFLSGSSGTPLFEVFSVTFEKNQHHSMFSSDVKFEIFGFIRVIDWKGNQYYLYNRDDMNPETLSFDKNDSTLSLTIEDVIVPSSAVHIELNLRDNIHDIEIATGVVDLKSNHIAMNYLLDNFSSSRIEGIYGTLVICYNAYQHALMGELSVQFRSKSPVNDDLTKVHGTIVAHCHKNCTHYSSYPLTYANSIELSRIVLFDKPLDQSIKAEFKVPIKLSRTMMAFPLHTSIIVEVDLWNADQHIVSGTVGFMNQWHFGAIGQPIFTSSDVYVTVIIDTDHAYLHNGTSEQVNRELPEPNRTIRVLDRTMEVYSIVVHCCKHKTSAIHGRVRVQDDSLTHILYDRDKSCAQQLELGNEIGPLVGPRHSIRGDTLTMDVTIIDEDGDFVSRGLFCGNFFDSYAYTPWCGMPLCHTADGKVGYAAVYYAVFSCAVMAKVRLIFVANTPANDIPVNVSGGLVARYSNFNPSVFQFDEEKYYQSKIYVKDPADVLRSNAQIILTKSVVAVALNASIIIDLHLKVSVIGDESNLIVDEIQGTVEFKTDVSGSMTCKDVQGRDYHAKVYVEWAV